MKHSLILLAAVLALSAQMAIADEGTALNSKAPDGTVAPMQILPGALLFTDQSEFGLALSAAILKKNVPVVSMTDSSKCDFFIHSASNERIEKGGERIAKALVFGGWMGSGRHFSATVTITNRDGAVVFAKNVKKENFQSAAESVAKTLKYDVEKAAKESRRAAVADAR